MTNDVKPTSRARRRHDARVRKDRANAVLANNDRLTRTPGGFENQRVGLNKTMAGVNPWWVLLNAGGNCHVTPATKQWLRCKCHRAERRAARAEIVAELSLS